MMNSSLDEFVASAMVRYNTAPSPRYSRYMFFRPSTSDVDDQTTRPSMFANDSSATNPAAAVAVTGIGVLLKKSVIIGDAFSRIPMPAVTLKHNTTQRSQNCGVLIALRADTLAVVISAWVLSFAGSYPAGRQSSAGTRISSTPSDMNTAYTRPCTRKASAIPLAPAPNDVNIAD